MCRIRHRCPGHAEEAPPGLLGMGMGVGMVAGMAGPWPLAHRASDVNVNTVSSSSLVVHLAFGRDNRMCLCVCQHARGPALGFKALSYAVVTCGRWRLFQQGPLPLACMCSLCVLSGTLLGQDMPGAGWHRPLKNPHENKTTPLCCKVLLRCGVLHVCASLQSSTTGILCRVYV